MQPTNTIISTTFCLPQSVVSNGATTGNQWTNPNDSLLVDSEFAESNPGGQAASDIILGNYNFQNDDGSNALPQNAVVVGVEVKFIGYRGGQTTPPISILPVLVDNTSGQNAYYPYTSPFTGLTPDSAEYIFGTPTYQFDTQFSVDQINNIKLQLIASGDVYMDSALLKIYYYVPATPDPVDPTEEGCIDCNSTIQAQPFYLAVPMSETDTVFTLQSFKLPNGKPITLDMLGACGGEIAIVFDESKPKAPGQDYEENAVITSDDATITILPNGDVQIDLGSLDNRGLGFDTPYTREPGNLSSHAANSKVIITNSARYQNRFLQKCHIGVLVSGPIEVLSDDTSILKPVTRFNFKGAGKSVSVNPTDPDNEVDILIPGAGGTTPPEVVSTTSATSGSTQVTTLSADLPITGLNRGTVVQISTEQAQTVVSVTVGGVACTQESISTDAGNNLRAEAWICVNPPLGTQPVVVTLSGNAYLSFGAECLNGVDTTTPVGSVANATGNNNHPVVSLATAYDYSLVIDGISTAKTPILFTPGAGQSLNWMLNANADTRQGASSTQAAGLEPDSIIMQYAITQSTPWAYVAVEIKGITSTVPPSAGVSSVTGPTVNNTNPATPIINPYVSARSTDTTPSYLDNKIEIVAGANVTVAKTVTNPGANEKIRYTVAASGGGGGGGLLNPGNEIVFNNGGPVTSPQIIKFGNFLLRKTAHGSGNCTIYTTDATTGALIISGISISDQFGMFVSTDGLTLYTLGYATNGSGQVTLTLKSYDTSLTLTNTATGTFTIGAGVTVQASPNILSFFVDGSNLVAELSPQGSTTLNFWTQYTISGTTLSSPTATNLQYFDGFTSFVYHNTAVNDGTNIYLQGAINSSGQYLPGNSAVKYTYSSLTFTSVATSTMPIDNPANINSYNTQVNHGGIIIPASGQIGWWRNTSVSINDGAGSTQSIQGRAIYNVYTF